MPGLPLVLLVPSRDDFSKRQEMKSFVPKEPRESWKSTYGQMALQWTKDEFSLFQS